MLPYIGFLVQVNALHDLTPIVDIGIEVADNGARLLCSLWATVSAPSTIPHVPREASALIFKIRSYSAISDLKNKSARFSGLGGRGLSPMSMPFANGG